MHQGRMDRTWPSLIGLTLGTTVLSQTIPTTVALGKPLHTSIATLLSSGIIVFILSRFLPRDGRPPYGTQSFEAGSLAEIGRPHPSRPSSPAGKDVAYPSSLRKLRIVVMTLLVAVLLRIAIICHTLNTAQCQREYLEPLVPLVFASWDFWAVQKKRAQVNDTNGDAHGASESISNAILRHISRRPYRCLVSTALFSIGGLIALNNTASPASSLICNVPRNRQWQIRTLQYFGFLFDIVSIRCITYLLQQQEGRGHRSVALRFASVGWSLIASALALLATSLVYLVFSARARSELVVSPPSYASDLMVFIFIVALTLVSALMMVNHAGVVATTFLIGFFSVFTITTSSAWSNLHPFPPTSFDRAYFGTCLAMIGFAVYFRVEAVSAERAEGRKRGVFAEIPGLFYLILVVFFIQWISLWGLHKDVVNFHPIDKLTYDALHHHSDYLNRSCSSSTLRQAVTAYKERYNRYPPPKFDTWYQFATKEKSVVIDNFDQIHHDLSPFYALSPSEIRQRTWILVSNPWNNITGIRVRGGKPSILSEGNSAYRWMAEGLLDHIGKFSEHLPDMDLAFNLRPEPRVVAPFEQLQSMLKAGNELTPLEKLHDAYSGDRPNQWKEIPEEPNSDTLFTSGSLDSSFFDFSSLACPRASPARSQRIWDTSKMCISCSRPQSLGAILSNWSIAADFCHQPDLANLHDLYTSTANFKATNSLYPVFSHAKIHGFNDILYPSTWDYLEKTKYVPNDDFPDPKFSLKNNTLFWRDTISTSPLPGPTRWQGTMRQRFIHFTNPSPSFPSPLQPLLLPESLSSFHSKRLRYTLLPIPILTSLLPTSIHHFLPLEPNLTTPSLDLPPSLSPDFQLHWQYKYLLDLDGPAPSTSFLPFLRSRSLPFKAALFREWYSDRLTPWLHFVPLDVRGHGLWATLAWFAGLEGGVDGGSGRSVRVAGHAREAERIAERGREWTSRALRREDMEVYFFRLLLEWGRLTDDRREELGFQVGEGGE